MLDPILRRNALDGSGHLHGWRRSAGILLETVCYLEVARSSDCCRIASPMIERELMQRLIEQPVGDGDLFEEGGRIGQVHYHLDVYQHFSDDGGPVPANLEVEGRISAPDDFDIPVLYRLGLEFTLRLADGRALDFRFVHEDGSIHSTARGLYTQD